jgi:hypothetical protein
MDTLIVPPDTTPLPAHTQVPPPGDKPPEKPKDDMATKLAEAFTSGKAAADAGDMVGAAAHARRALLIAEPDSGDALVEPREEGKRRRTSYSAFRKPRTPSTFKN